MLVISSRSLERLFLWRTISTSIPGKNINLQVMDFLRVELLTKHKGSRPAVEGVSFTLRQGEQLGIAGETGSGKSTLLKIIAGFEQADHGRVSFKGHRVEGPLEKLIPGHPGIAYLSQHFELRNHYRVEEILEYATLLSAAEAARIFSLCRIEHLLKRKTDQLSGGEKQRIALARLLVSSPSLLILDEPFSNLDLIHKNIIQSVIEDLQRELNISCILVSHDPTDLLSWADTILIMRQGILIQQDVPETIYRKPVDLYAAALMGKLLAIPAEMAARLTGEQVTKDMVYARPENIQFDSNGPVKGIVRKVMFFGQQYVVDIEAMGIHLRIPAGKNPPQTGSSIAIRLDPGALIAV